MQKWRKSLPIPQFVGKISGMEKGQKIKAQSGI